MNALAIVNDALERLNYQVVTTLAAVTNPGARILRFVNQHHRRVLADPKMSRLRDDQITFASVASQMRYALPPSVQRIKRIWEQTNYNRLEEKSLDWLRDDPLAATYTGVPRFYIPLGITAITQQPASTGLWVASTSAADTTQKASVDAIRSGGYINTPAQTTLTGATRVQLGTLTTYVDVLKFWVDSTIAGDVSLYDAATSGNTLATIPRGRKYSRYYTINLWAVPSSAITYYVDCERQIQDMALDMDEPIWPEDFHWLLVSCAVYQELLIKKDPMSAQIYINEVTPGLKQLLGFVVNNDDYLIVPDSRRPSRIGSNLGSWFPSGR